MQAGEGRELATEGLFVLRCAGGCQLLERQVLSGSVPILDEPNTSGSSFTEDPFHEIAVAGDVFRCHEVIVRPLAPIRAANRRKMSRLRDTVEALPSCGIKLLFINT